MTSSPPLTFGRRLSAERTRIPTALRSEEVSFCNASALGSACRPISSNSCRPVSSSATCAAFPDRYEHKKRLVNYPPKVAISTLVNSLKGVSSRMIRQKKYPSIRKKLWGGALWSLLFCRKLRWRTHRDRAPVHRATENAALTSAKDAWASALSFPTLTGEVCCAIRSICRLNTGLG